MRHIRTATHADASTIYRFIVELAVYEKEPDAVEVTPEILAAQLQQPEPPFSCLLLESDGMPIGFALYFFNYSTWRGAPGLYLEDLYVTPEHRGAGHGRALLVRLAAIASAHRCARMEWVVLDWNTTAMAFYETLGARPVQEWTIFRLTGEPLHRLAAESALSSETLRPSEPR